MKASAARAAIMHALVWPDSTTPGNITDHIILRYPDRHTRKGGFSASP